MFTIFAAFNANEQLYKILVDGYFYGCLNAVICKDKRLSNPCGLLPNICNSVRWREWEAIAFLIYYNFSSTMPTKEKNYRSANHSTAPVTPRSATTVSMKKFIVEMNAKNKAYYFLLSHGLLKQFSEFCKNYDSNNPHEDCVDYLFPKQTSHA